MEKGGRNGVRMRGRRGEGWWERMGERRMGEWKSE